MNGKYYGVYDIKNEDSCVGVFESTREICAFFGDIREKRVSCAISRKKPLAFKSERYWVEVFQEVTENGVRRRLWRELRLKISVKVDGVYVREDRRVEWRWFASGLEDAVGRLGRGDKSYLLILSIAHNKGSSTAFISMSVL